MRVRWLRKALCNLDDKAAYIAMDDAAAARLVVQRALAAVAQLVEQPAFGRPGRAPGTRGSIVTGIRYIVPYRARGEWVEILRVFHTLRRLLDRC